MAASVQFYGQDNIITAAENRNCPRWAIFSGRQFLFKYEGTDKNESLQFLEKILESLREAGTVATYTLRFYEDNQKIKDNTPYDGSFNFRLVEEEERQQKALMYAGNSKLVIERLEAIEQKLSGVDQEEDEEEEPETINSILMGFLKEPQKIEQMLGIVGKIFGGAKYAGAISGTPAITASSNEEEIKIAEAVEVLKANDSKIGDHLLKLAGIAKEKPEAFKYLLTLLESQ